MCVRYIFLSAANTKNNDSVVIRVYHYDFLCKQSLCEFRNLWSQWEAEETYGLSQHSLHTRSGRRFHRFLGINYQFGCIPRQSATRPNTKKPSDSCQIACTISYDAATVHSVSSFRAHSNCPLVFKWLKYAWRYVTNLGRWQQGRQAVWQS